MTKKRLKEEGTPNFQKIFEENQAELQPDKEQDSIIIL